MSLHNMYPMGKGDPLCPLGFHPQVRWPTRCKRCFRDYKEHGGKRKEPELRRKDDIAASSPALTSFGSPANRKSWSSSTTLDQDQGKEINMTVTFKNPSSWTSTPDLGNLDDDAHASIPTVSLTLPLRRKIPPVDTGQTKEAPSKPAKSSVLNKSDNLAARVKRLSSTRESIPETPARSRVQVKEVKPPADEALHDHDLKPKASKREDFNRSDSLEPDDDAVSLAGTDTTESTTLVDANEYDLKQQLDTVRQELEASRIKCERLEKEKSNILLRRLTAIDTSKGNSSEVLKLQQKVNELQSQLDDYKDEKKSLNLKVRELEEDLDNRPAPQATQKAMDELKSKLLAAETLCEELMDENEDMKKELRDIEEEMEEMQDHFREDQADEYSSLKKELEQATKNCRILSFKLRKTERKTEELEQDKVEFENKVKELSGGTGIQQLDKLKQLEKDLSKEKETNTTLQKKLDDANAKLSKATENKLANTLPKRKAPMLGSLGKSASSEMRVSRESLTRGGSQDDPVQLLRDLQDSLEREADLREQLKFAEEEADTSRKKASRFEEDNESLVLQLKKMATTRTRPLTRKSSLAKDDKEEDPSVIKLQLELNEQETSVLRKKIEELESDNERFKKKTKELQDKVNTKTIDRKFVSKFDKDNGQNDKVKALETEMNEIRTKLIEKERDCERLEAEIKLTKKLGRDSSKSRSQESLDQSIDLKRQLQVIEQEASVFRNKAQDLETENETLQKDLKRLELLKGPKSLQSDKNLNMYIDKIAKLQIELEAANKKVKEFEGSQSNGEAKTKDPDLAKKAERLERERDKLQKLLDKVKDNSSKAFKARKPKAPTDLSTKLALKTMINDLENEVQAILGALGAKESEYVKLEEELAKSKTIKGAKDNTNKELEELTRKYDSLQQDYQKDKSRLEELSKSVTNLEVEKEEFKLKITNMKKEQELLSNENKRMESEVSKLKTETSSLKDLKREVNELKEHTESQKRELEKKEAEIRKLREDVEEKSKLTKELLLKTKKVAELQKKLKEAEDDLGNSERLSKDRIKQLERNLDDEKRRGNQEMDENNLLRGEKEKLNFKIQELETIIATKISRIESLEKDLKKERSNTSVVIKSPAEPKELKTLKEELAKLKTELSDTESKSKQFEKKMQTAEEKTKKIENDFKTEKTNLEKKASELEIDLQNEKKKLQLQKSNAEKELKNRELELTALKNKIKSLELASGGGSKKISEVRQECQDKIDRLEKQLEKEKKEYENLTAKYEVLEEEHVVTKAKLVSELETLTSQVFTTRKELERLEEDYEGAKDELNKKYDTLKKENSDLMKKFANNEADNPRYKVLFEQKQEEIDKAKKENELIHDQIEYMRKENDDLRKKLDDFDKVSKIQRNISADSSAMDKEMRELRIKVASLEKSKKSDLSELKMRYEGQITILNHEMHSLQAQVSRFKREKDTYKHMLEQAQKTIGDLKVNPGKAKDNRNSITIIDDMEEYKSKIANLEQQISCMEDELSESRLEASKLKTDLISERSSWEVRLSELNSRVNELEEEKILTSGRTKVAGVRTRMELSWQKEREDQQRLVQETATLARDLRQTLFEVERERDKEILEGKRKQEQLKKTLEEDQSESKKKMNELQCDFMELRDAHAKLRTTNEKLRREKDRHEKEREEMKSFINERKRSELDDLRRIQILVQQVENLLQVAPELFGNTRERSEAPYTPTPPKRHRSKSREGSPSLERKDYSRESSVAREEKRTQVQSTLQRLVDATEELRRIQERDRLKRMSMRRATSTENDQLASNGGSLRKLTRSDRNDGNLHRKSLSLEHTASMQDRNIWKGGDDDSISSLQSLDMGSDLDFRYKRDVSMDSRLSGGSTQSEVSGEKKKKNSLMGKLKKLTKSRSIDDSDDSHFSPSKPLSSKAPSNSSDISEDQKGSKKDLKERITGMFKRSGSQSRSNSVERQIVKHDTSSTQRPLMRNANGNNSTSASNSSTDKLTKPLKNKT